MKTCGHRQILINMNDQFSKTFSNAASWKVLELKKINDCKTLDWNNFTDFVSALGSKDKFYLSLAALAEGDIVIVLGLSVHRHLLFFLSFEKKLTYLVGFYLSNSLDYIKQSICCWTFKTWFNYTLDLLHWLLICFSDQT